MSEEQVKSLQHLIQTGQGFANECRLTHTLTHTPINTVKHARVSMQP